MATALKDKKVFLEHNGKEVGTATSGLPGNCLYVSEGKKTVFVFPDPVKGPAQEISLPAAPRLFRGSLVPFVALDIFSEPQVSSVKTLDLQKREVADLIPGESEDCPFVALDVDKTGQYIVAAAQFDDFPQIWAYDGVKNEAIKFNSDCLIDMHVETVKWKKGHKSILVGEDNEEFGLDWENLIVTG